MQRHEVRALLDELTTLDDEWFPLRPTNALDRYELADGGNPTADVLLSGRWVEIVAERRLDSAQPWDDDEASGRGTLIRTQIRGEFPPMLTVRGRVYFDGFSLQTFFTTASDVLALAGPVSDTDDVSDPRTESADASERLSTNGPIAIDQAVEDAATDLGHLPAIDPRHDPGAAPPDLSDASDANLGTASERTDADAPPPPMADTASPLSLPEIAATPSPFDDPALPAARLGDLSSADADALAARASAQTTSSYDPSATGRDTDESPASTDARIGQDVDRASGMAASPTDAAAPPPQATTAGAATPDTGQPGITPPDPLAVPQPAQPSEAARARTPPERLVSQTLAIPRRPPSDDPAVAPSPTSTPAASSPPAAPSGSYSAAPSSGRTGPHPCPVCASDVEPRERFCINCGSPQPASADTPPPPTRGGIDPTGPTGYGPMDPRPSGGRAGESATLASPWGRVDAGALRCRVCNHINPADSRHCESCGARLGDVPSPPTPHTSGAPPSAQALPPCPQCGFRNRAENRFCQGCGRALAAR